MFPGDALEFFFDQSSAHGAFAKDALNAKEMNVKPGGKQRVMRNTYIPQDNPDPASAKATKCDKAMCHFPAHGA